MSNKSFIIARLSSTRLPQKNILPICNKPMIVHLAERVSRAAKVDDVIITTSVEPSDDPLEAVADQYGIKCFRGSLDNVMERITGAAREYAAENIIEILGDNPLVHAGLIDDVLDLFTQNNLDYAANVTKEYALIKNKKLFSVGIRVQVYKAKIAEQYTQFPDYMSGNKHPCAFIFENPSQFKVGFMEATGKWQFANKPELNFAVNYPKNFDLITRFFNKNYPDDPDFSLQKVYAQLANDPSLLNFFGAE